MEFPDDATVSELTTQWMDGDKLMVAPVIKQDNTSSVYFPAGTWYVFNGATDAAVSPYIVGPRQRITLKFHLTKYPCMF